MSDKKAIIPDMPPPGSDRGKWVRWAILVGLVLFGPRLGLTGDAPVPVVQKVCDCHTAVVKEKK